ncbi:LamG-like jellyroll fold domain-containing protein, partial [Anaerobaca lacustris]|nr:discoidin domain-containing protein [Sedimentisphaerales bacterium M17dextr]
MRGKLSYVLVLTAVLAAGDVSRAGIQKWEALVRAADPIHWYRFNEEPGTTTALDEGSGGLEGTYRGLVELGQEGLFGLGQAVRFERGGQNDVMWTQGGNVTGDEWTAEFIVMIMSRTVAQALSDSGAFSLRIVGWGVDEEVSFTQYGVIDARFTAVGGADLVAPIEQWIHVVYRRSGGQVQVFLDGVLAGATSTLIDCPIDSFGGRAASDSDGMDGFMDEAVIYDYALTDAQILAHATAPLLPDVGAIALQPEDGATDVTQEIVLSWAPGTYAETHDVYFGTVFDDVNAASRSNSLGALVSQGQADSTYDPPGNLELGQTYYWRIDEVNGAPDYTIFKGDIWSFTVEPVAYPIDNIIASSNGVSDQVSVPERTVDGSGLDALDQHSTTSEHMWLAGAPADEALYIQYEFDRLYKLHEMLVWNYNGQFELLLGFGLRDVTIAYSETGEDWTALDEVELPRATAAATYTAGTVIDFGGVAARYVRLTVHSGWGVMGQFGLSEVRFTYIPAQAREPQPADGQIDVDVDASLSWRAGRDAVSHEVYFGTSPDELALDTTPDQAVFTPDALHYGTTYYWRVDEVTDETWAGQLWSFRTREYALIDDFESYTDNIEAGEAIFDTWIDGWVNN